MTQYSTGQRITASISLLALLFAILTFVRIIIADPIGWVGITGGTVLFFISLYWLILGRDHRRILASLTAIAALLLIVHLLGSAPISNVWNSISCVLLLLIATLAGRQALKSPDTESSAATEESSGNFRRMTLLINPKSGGGKAEKFGIIDKARAMGVDVRVLRKEDDLLSLAREAAESGAEVLAMGGGDGSLGLVASIAMEYDLPFICIPVGTRNHFAMDMNLDRNDPVKALAAFAGEERLIDVAMIGDRVFLNNASFGIYAATLNEPGYREAKARAFHSVISEVLNGDREAFDLQFDSPGGKHEHAFVVFVGNNPYQFIGLEDLGGRPKLDTGQLQITALESSDHEALTRLAQGMIIGNPDFTNGFQQWNAESFEINADSPTLAAGVDGEALEFPTPVKLTVKPRALRVLVPPGTPTEYAKASVLNLAELQKLGEMVR